MAAGLHVVSKRADGKPLRRYIYAWRGGPLIHKATGARPRITAAISDAAAEARRARGAIGAKETMAALIAGFRGSPGFARLAKSIQAAHQTWLDRIGAEFGDAPLRAFDDRRIRSDILDWRDRWASQPRSADAGVSTLSRLLNWGVDRGMLEKNVATGISTLYDVDRSEVIWEAADFERFAAAASVEVNEGVALAAFTGLRRGDASRAKVLIHGRGDRILNNDIACFRPPFSAVSEGRHGRCD